MADLRITYIALPLLKNDVFCHSIQVSSQSKTIQSKSGVRDLKRIVLKQYEDRPDLAFFLQEWDDPYNVGGLFRVADACGARELFMSGHTAVPPDPQISVTSLGHHRRIPFRHFKRHEEAAEAALAAGYSLVAVELAEGAVDYTQFEWPSKVCLVLGNEVKGVYGAVMKHCAASVYVPMFGKGRSMNVHVTAAIVAFRALLR